MKLKFIFFLLTAIILVHKSLIAQTTVTLRLDSMDEDAQIQTSDVNLNQGDLIEYYVGGWTSGGPVTWKQLLKFNLSSIPSSAIVQSAHLDLFFPTINLNHSFCCDTSLTHSDGGLAERITSPWSENMVTWNTQPTFTAFDEVNIPASINATENYELDVTAMVQTMISTVNYGFLLQEVDTT